MHEKVNTIVYLRNRNKDEILTMGYQKKLKVINDHQKHAARNDFNQDKRTHSRPLLQSPNALYIAQFFPIIILVFFKKNIWTILDTTFLSEDQNYVMNCSILIKSRSVPTMFFKKSSIKITWCRYFKLLLKSNFKLLLKLLYCCFTQFSKLQFTSIFIVWFLR